MNNSDNEPNVTMRAVTEALKAPFVARAIEEVFPLLDKQKLAEALFDSIISVAYRRDYDGPHRTPIYNAVNKLVLEWLNENKDDISKRIVDMTKSRLDEMIKEIVTDSMRLVGRAIGQKLEYHRE